MTEKLSSKKVPSEGPRTAKIFCVGESPGEDEESEGRPFVGKAGALLERYLGRAGVRRDHVFFSNLCKYRPLGNRFEYCLGTDALHEGIDELKGELESVRPNVIIALGNWPMYFLTGLMADAKNAQPGTGITTWRGSTVPCKLVEGRKVTVTYHPAFIVRPNGFGNNPIFLSDIIRGVEESLFPDLRYPQYEGIVDPDPDRLGELVREFSDSEYLTIDIETFGPELACIGFGSGVNRGVCLTFQEKQRNWEAAQILLRSKAKKIFHFGQFDVNYLKHYKNWETKNYAYDTYIAANTLNPGFPKTLAFLTSLHTKFPYYKEDRKEWKETFDLNKLFNYNIKDVIATHTIALEQQKELEEW